MYQSQEGIRLVDICDHLSIKEYVDWLTLECCVGFRKHLYTANEDMLNLTMSYILILHSIFRAGERGD